jgi:alpha,alpha-trehalose phosphorylase
VQPPAVTSALRWRQATLPAARERAQLLGLRGAAFPWRTIDGRESSTYWPASTAAVHINADIADAVVRYIDANPEDDVFEPDTGLELLVETARLWQSLGHYDGQGQFRIDGVTGPNEYNALVDNNVYTNLMAEQNLRAAADVAMRHPDRARALGVQDEETAAWRAAAMAMVIPYDDNIGVHPQADGFTNLQEWDFASTPPESYPLLLHYSYFQLYRKQVVKQPDLVLAMHLRCDAFTDDQKARNFDYYERLTVRDSSLAAGTQCVLAAEVGHLGLAYDYLGEAALMDLKDLEHNTRDGVHLASLAGAWIALVDGFGGMRAYNGTLWFAPRLPDGLTRLVLNLCYRDRRLRVTATPTSASYELVSGKPLRLAHYDEPLTLSGDGALTRAIPPCPRRVAPSQPIGREPVRRRRSGAVLHLPVD